MGRKLAECPTLTYQGYPCLSGAFEVPYGVAPGHGHVVMPQRAWKRLLTGDPWAPHGGGDKKEQDRAGDDKMRVLTSSLAIRGPLIFSHGGGRSVALPAIYIADTGVEDVRRSVETTDVGTVRVPLVDVRYLWATRGDICGGYNLLPDGLRPVSGKTEMKDGGDGKRFTPESRKPDGTAYTLADMIRLLLSRLPGNVPLKATGPELAAAEAIIPENLVYRGEQAGPELSKLLDAWNFRGVYDPISDAFAIWRLGEGQPEAADQGGNLLSLTMPRVQGGFSVPPTTVTNRRRRTQHFYRPKAVRIVGKPIIREIEVTNLEAVGEIDGDIVPLDDALKRHGMDREDATKWVMLPRELREAWRDGALSRSAISDLDRWAFKWFRIPEALLPLLPALPYRAVAMVNGGRQKPVVWADTFDEVAWRRLFARLEIAKATIEQTLKRAKSALHQEFGPAAAKLDAVRKAGLLRPSPFSARRRLSKALLDELEGELDILDRELKAADVAQRAMETELALSERSEVRALKVPLDLFRPSEYEWDHRQGVVRFGRPVGFLRYSGGAMLIPGKLVPNPHYGKDGDRTQLTQSPPTHFKERGWLDPNPRVKVCLAYESTPQARRAVGEAAEKELSPAELAALRVRPASLDKANEYEDLYTLLCAPGANGKVEILNRDGEPDPEKTATLYPRVLRHPLQMYVDIDGDTNRGDLDSMAIGLCEREFGAPEQLHGERGEAATFLPLTPTGAVSSVEWELTGGKASRARTRWSVGTEKEIESRQPTGLRKHDLGTPAGSVTNPEVRGG